MVIQQIRVFLCPDNIYSRGKMMLGGTRRGSQGRGAERFDFGRVINNLPLSAVVINGLVWFLGAWG